MDWKSRGRKAGKDVHALRPEDDEEDPDEGEYNDHGRPCKVAEPGSVGGNAQVACEDGHLDEARSEEEEGLSCDGDLASLGDLPWLQVPDMEVPAVELCREDDTDCDCYSEDLSEVSASCMRDKKYSFEESYSSSDHEPVIPPRLPHNEQSHV